MKTELDYSDEMNCRAYTRGKLDAQQGNGGKRKMLPEAQPYYDAGYNDGLNESDES